MLTREGRTGRSAGAIAAFAIAAVAIAGLAAAPSADVATWSAHAQSSPTTVKVGALMANATGSDFRDDNRTAAIERAVGLFNGMYGDIALDLSVTEFARNETMSSEEPGALIGAYNASAGPSFYIGPTTSEGLTNIRDNATTRALLDGDEVLLVSPSSEAQSLAIDDNIFRLAFNVARQGDMLVDEMASAGIKSYIVVARNDAWGKDVSEYVGERAGREGLASRGDPIMFDINRSATHWAEVRDQVESSAGSVPAGEDKIGVFFFGYDDDYSDMAAAAANSADAIRDNTTWFAPSSTGIGAPSPISNDTARDFSTAVGLTALSQDIADGAAKRGIDRHLFADGRSNATFYEYSAHDSVFVLGHAMRMAMAAGGDASNVTTVKKYMAAAAMNYTGAALGEGLLLNGDGDLRAPDRFTVHTLDRSTGDWSDGRTVGSTVTLVGALLAINNTDYKDDNARDALLQAAADYNNGTDRRPLVKLITYNITDPTNSGGYVALDALMRAYDGGNGPSAYIGPSLSSNVKEVLNYSNDNDILLLSYGSESEELSVRDDNLFRMAVSTDRHGKFMAEVMKDAGVESVVTVVRGDSWGLSYNASIADALGPNGLSLAGSVKFMENNTAWGPALDAIAAAAAKGGMVGVAFVGVDVEQNSLAAAALANSTARAVPWFVSPTGYYEMEGDALDFAKAVNMTAIVNDVEENVMKSALDKRVGGLDFYDYAAYDSLFILGNTIAAAVESGKTMDITADDLRPLVPAQADAYDGILGDIALNANGDLGSPDRFAVWRVDSTSGEWMRTGPPKSTPVVRIGALLAIDNTDYADNNARDALRQASADFNAMGDGDRPFYVSLTTYDITDPADSGKYAANDTLMSAYDGGNGPSVYIGPSLSSNVEAVLPYATSNDLILLGYASESESLSIKGDNLFRTAISTARHGHFMAEVMADAGVKSVVTVVRDDPWGRSMSASIVEALAPNGLRLAGAVEFTPNAAEWGTTLDEIAAAIGENAGAGVAFVGVKSEQDRLAEAAPDGAAARAVPWFVTPSGQYQDMPDATRDFARAVGMTAIALDVEDGDKKSALDGKVAGDLNFYDYAAYDSLFILGNSVAAASSGTGRAVSALDATDLRPVIPAQADMYEGILGDIALNSKGDLRSPDRFAVWKVNSTSGMWMDTGVTKSTPVVDVGAIVILESDRFDDSPRLEAMRIAVDEYNEAAEDGGALYLNLRVVNTSLSPGSATPSSPVAHEAVMAASSGEDGMRYYVGPSTSGNSKRVLEYANENNLTLISPSSTAPSLATEGDALFRLVPNDSQQGKVLADIVHNQQGALLAALINQTGHEHVVMVVRNDTWGQGLDASTSGRLGVHDVDITRIVHDESDADWSQTAMDISAEIGRVRTATPNDPIAVLHIGFPGDFVSLAAQASDYPDMKTVPWFGTDGVAGTAPLVTNDTARQFADDVNLTATKFDVVANDRFDALTAALESRGVPVRTTYEYSAYDSVFVLGRAIEAAMLESDSYGPLDVRASVRAAAAEYEGALGDIELNKAGDLRTPNSYAAWTVEGDSWIKVDTHPSTPVFDVGALLMLDNNPVWTDEREKAAMDVAVDDFNTDHELVGDFYLNLAVQRISIAPNTESPDPDALAGLMRAYANGAGPSLYVGPSTSGNTGRVLDYANANGIVLISHSSTAPSLAMCGDNLFRMVAPDSRQGGVLADLIGAGGAGVTDLVMAVRDDTWGRGVDGTTAAGLGNATSVTRVSFGESEGDWAGVAARLGAAVDTASASAAARPQGTAAVLFIGFAGDFNSVASQSSAVPSLSSVRWFGPDGVGNSPAITANATSLAFARQVNITTVIFTVRDNAVNERLDPSAVYGPSAYDSVRIMGDAIKAAYAGSGSMPPALDVKAQIPPAAAAYAGALGNVTLDANGDLLSPSAYGVYRIGAGDNWELVRVQDAHGDAGACDARYITIGELFTAAIGEVGPLNDAVHKAYALAVEDYNREEAAAGSAVRVQLQRVDAPTASAVEGVSGAYAGGSGPVAYLGPVLPSTAASLARYATDNGLVMVSPGATSASLAARDNFFRLSLTDRYEADLLAIAAHREGVRTVLPVLLDAELGRSYGSEIRIEAEKLGMAYLTPVYVPLARQVLNLSSTVSEIDGIVAGLESNGTDLSSVGIIAVALNKDLHSLAEHAVDYPRLTSVGWFEPTLLFAPQAIADPETLRFAQAAPFYSLSWDVPRTERLERVSAELAEREGFPPNQFSYAAYDAVYMLADAIKMSMAPDGSYTGTAVASNMHAAADGLDGMLGGNVRLDANGDRILPNRAIIWKTSGEGVWEDTEDRASLDPVCGISLERGTISLGRVSAGGQSGIEAQTITNVGTLSIDGMEIGATDWTNSANATVLDKGATSVMIGDGAWTPLSGAATTSPEGVQTDAKFRLDVPRSTPQGSAGDAEQIITYTASCGAP